SLMRFAAATASSGLYSISPLSIPPSVPIFQPATVNAALRYLITASASTSAIETPVTPTANIAASANFFIDFSFLNKNHASQQILTQKYRKDATAYYK